MKKTDTKNAGFMVWILGIIILFGVLFTVPLDSKNMDVTFTATIKNNLNECEIISLDRETKKSTILQLPENLQMAGIFDIIKDIFRSGEMELVAEMGDIRTSQNVDKLYLFEEVDVTLTLQKVPVMVNDEFNNYFEIRLYEKLENGETKFLYIWSGYL